ncbi:nitroreductase family deazaflavin-dependent oxidoreductase [Actinacidiphila sp. bgisy160]|uniref:nitroreductase family deazaflavin-dependent oxidoreductase n=1 Tax=Actinacidiphila sp. bgisy160 TaxID=3413796 RepID=UPI003D71FA02
MPHRTRTVQPPTGLRRTLLRAPIQLYRWRLGWLLGSRMLLLTHTGRDTGLPRQVVLEVTGRDPDTGAYRLAAGFGEGSQWYRNIRRTPWVTIQTGLRTTPAVARPLPPDESGRLMAAYASRHPRLARRLMRLCGLETDGSADDYYLIGRDHIPFVAVTPAPPDE